MAYSELLLQPFDARSHAFKSYVMMYTCGYSLNMKSAEIVLALDPEEPLAWSVKGYTHLMRKEFEEAHFAGGMAERLSSKFGQDLPYYHLTLMDLGAFDAALQQAQAWCAKAWCLVGESKLAGS
eukprot:Protomagalhaensia_wolfi_Nauph_80__3061@NODE_3132_length_881_cov_39_026128_g2455_i0_p1_GENE_NODE_3132_length_881_cov_39_026128_g2455_i0NODE_3132_length_881_cov_39_026128_g2455_i0_p1_ORF_typecomplete_len124_score18_41TPR_16/PF13432_6/0_0017TPR_16/PF13432_6/46TPR_9/PF13371_6/0_22TPR_9/PF13371_6/4_5e02TPR_19/PF14559_6/0_46TPR_19/PF14559_6/1_8e02ANAPC3/PF12895_7/0_12ANAPC3/PF12895_7/1_4e02TPR_15/PF13429_6/0_11_NODE_3132_length_881_cov_39_026128_g2455_i0132503